MANVNVTTGEGDRTALPYTIEGPAVDIVTPTLKKRVADLVWRAERRLEATVDGLTLRRGDHDPTVTPVYSELAFKRVVERLRQVESSWRSATEETTVLLHQIVGSFPLESAAESAALGELINAGLHHGGRSNDPLSMSLITSGHHASTTSAGAGGGMRSAMRAASTTAAGRVDSPLHHATSGGTVHPHTAAAALVVEQRFRDLEREHTEQATELAYCQAKLKRREVALEYVQAAFLREMSALQALVSAKQPTQHQGATGLSAARGTFSLVDWLEVLELHFDPRSGAHGAGYADAIRHARREERRREMTRLVSLDDSQAAAEAALGKFAELHEIREFELAVREREEEATNAITALQEDLKAAQMAAKEATARHMSDISRHRSQVLHMEQESGHLKNDIHFASQRIHELEHELEHRASEGDELRKALEEQAAQANLSALEGLANENALRSTAESEAQKLALERRRIYGLLDKVLQGKAVSREDIMSGVAEDDPSLAGFLRGAEEMKDREAQMMSMGDRVDELEEMLTEAAERTDAHEAALNAVAEYFHGQGVCVPRPIKAKMLDDPDEDFVPSADVDWADEARSLQAELDGLSSAHRNLQRLVVANVDTLKRCARDNSADEMDHDDPASWAGSSFAATSMGAMTQGSPPLSPGRAGSATLTAPTFSDEEMSTRSSEHADSLEQAGSRLATVAAETEARIERDAKTIAQLRDACTRQRKVAGDARDAGRRVHEQLNASREETNEVRSQLQSALQDVAHAEARIRDLEAACDELKDRGRSPLQQRPAMPDDDENIMSASGDTPVATAATPSVSPTAAVGSPLRTSPSLAAPGTAPLAVVTRDGTAQTDDLQLDDGASDGRSPPQSPKRQQHSDEPPPTAVKPSCDDVAVQTDYVRFAYDPAGDAGLMTPQQGAAPLATPEHTGPPSAGKRGGGGGTKAKSGKPGGGKAAARRMSGSFGAAVPTSPPMAAASPSKPIPTAVEEQHQQQTAMNLTASAAAPKPLVDAATVAPPGEVGTVSADVIEQLWRAIDESGAEKAATAVAKKQVEALRQGSRGGAPLGHARAACTRCGESMAFPAARPVLSRTASTNTTEADVFGQGQHGGGKAAGKKRGASSPRQVSVAQKATQCVTVGDDPAYRQERHDAGDEAALALSVIEAAGPSHRRQRAVGHSGALVAAERGPVGHLVTMGTQTAGWIEASGDYAQALAAPESLRLSRHTLKYHRRHYSKMGRLRSGDAIDGGALMRGALEPRHHREGSSSSSESDLDAGIEALRELEALGMVGDGTDEPQAGGHRHFANGVWGSVPRRVAGAGAAPSVAASSSALEDYAAVVSKAHPVSWEMDGGLLPSDHHASSVNNRQPPRILPAPRVNTPPVVGAGGSRSRLASAQSTRVSTPGPLGPRASAVPRPNGLALRPSSVGLGGRSSTAPGSRPPSGAAVAAAKSKLLSAGR